MSHCYSVYIMFGQSSWESKILGANPIKLEYKSNEISFFFKYFQET